MHRVKCWRKLKLWSGAPLRLRGESGQVVDGKDFDKAGSRQLIWTSGVGVDRRVGSRLLGALALSVLLCGMGCGLRRWGAGVSLASHKGENAERENNPEVKGSLRRCQETVRQKKLPSGSCWMVPFFCLLRDDSFSQHVLVEVRLQISWVRVL